jgi:hypothetical protein
MFSHLEYLGTILPVNRLVERRTRHYFSDQVVRSQETRRAGRDGRYCSRLSSNDIRIFETYALLGLVYKKGPFSISEEQNIRDAIEEYRVVSPFSASSTRTLLS